MTQNTLQSSYSQYAAAALSAGSISDMVSSQVVSLICESASVGFGLAISRGSADNGAVKGGAMFLGVSIRDVTLLHSTADQYEQYDNIGVIVEGDVWVTAGTNVAVDHQVYYNSSTGAFGASTITNAVAVAGAKWLDTVSSTGLARIRLSSTVGHYTA